MLIAVCSEHGFAGPFNDHLLDRVEAEIDGGRRLLVVGRRGAAMARERGLAVDWETAMATHVGGVPPVTRRLAARLADVSAAGVVFGSYRRGGHFQVESRAILPLDPALTDGLERRGPPLHHLPPGELLRRLTEEYLFGELTRAVMDSLASENGARLRVMEAADRNIGDKLDDLRRDEHSLRQEAITSELLDVVTGSEAILGQADNGRP